MNHLNATGLSIFISLGALSLGHTAGPIVVSDGPDTAKPVSAQKSTAPSSIVISDGPMEFTSATRAGKRLNGAWVVETSGPGTGKLVVLSDGPTAKAPTPKNHIEISDGPVVKPVPKTAKAVHPKQAPVPEPETSTLAPAVVAMSHPVQTTPSPAVKKEPIALGEWVPAKDKKTFEVYSDKAYDHHFFPTGWMGDYGDARIEEGSIERPHSGSTCIRITYMARSSQGNGWVSLYWQSPSNNWGDKAGGYDLSDKKSLIFWARGDKGGEVINDFRVGGIGGAQGDSDTANIGPITLSKQWRKYTIRLAQKNLAHIIGGFSWSINRDANPNGATFYLDDIRFE